MVCLGRIVGLLTCVKLLRSPPDKNSGNALACALVLLSSALTALPNASFGGSASEVAP